jgi:hypothetical protein
MIRPDLLRAVFTALESHRYLSIEDFVVEEFAIKDKQPCLRVKYRYDPSLFFNSLIPAQKSRKSADDGHETYRFSCTMRPGRESVEETLAAHERTGLISEIKEWLGRVYDDVVSAPAVRQFHEHSQAIDQLKERLSVLPDEPMSRGDVQDFSDGLEKLKADLSEQLRQHTADKDELRKRVEELSQDIEFLKGTLDSMTKRKWGELFVARVQRWKDRFSLRQISAGAKVLKLLLPGSSADTLDSVTDVIDGVADIIDKTPKPPASC